MPPPADCLTSSGRVTYHDVINRPEHYTFSGIEVIDAIEAWDLGFHLGNVVKYIALRRPQGQPG